MNAPDYHTEPAEDAPLKMPARIEAFDWSTTPLGRRDDWPASLQAAIELAHGHGVPMAIWWGPQLTAIYNQAHADLLGSRHPAALGKSARDAWSDLWPMIESQVQAVLQTGAFSAREQLQVTDPVQSAASDAWFTFHFGRINDDDGRPAGVFVTAVSETARVFADRQRNKLTTALSFISDFAYLFDLDGRFTFANKALLDLWGMTLGEAIGKNFFDLHYPHALAEQLQRQIQEVIATKKKIAAETEYTSPSGLTRGYEYIFSPVMAEDGSVTAVAGSTRDVTDRRHADAALRQSEARFRFLSELAERTRDLLDPAQVMADVARALGEHLRVSRCAYADVEPDSENFTIRHDYTDNCASTTGMYHLSLFGPRAAADQRAGRTLVINDVDLELPPDQGAQMFNAIGIKAVICCPLVRQGRLVAMMAVHQTTPRKWTSEEIGLVEAVVERSWAYIERARAARALTQSESSFRELADAMPQIVWAARPDGTLDYYNRRWFDYIDRPAEDAEAVRWDRYIHPDDLARTVEAWTQSIQTGTPYVIEFRVRRANEQYRWFLVRALPIRDGGQIIMRWFGTCTDIQEQKELQAQREQLLESERSARSEAERASKMKDEFLATLSHEIRTPLNAILGWSQILRQSEDLDDIAQGLDVIERNAKAQSQIIEDLLDMSRIISGKVRLDMKPLDLAGIVQSAVDTARPTADAKGVRLQAIIDPLRGIPISGDSNRLQQVLWNLLSNAVKFTPRDGRIQVTLQRVNSHLEIGVSDTGEGMKSEFLPFVFDRFRQADSSTTRRHGGLGLGLSIVKQLVELHGGTIRVASPGPGLGTTFTVSLPLNILAGKAQPKTGTRTRKTVSCPTPAGAKLKGVRVLVVDDEPDASALVKRLLEDCDALVMTAASVQEAMELVQCYPFDVLVSDVGMPGEDGYSLIKRIRAMSDGKNRNIPAIALTAYARAEDQVKAVSAGFLMHVSKPVNPVELLTMVAGAAGKTA